VPAPRLAWSHLAGREVLSDWLGTAEHRLKRRNLHRQFPMRHYATFEAHTENIYRAGHETTHSHHMFGVCQC
jgi:hypothetical protein